MVGAALPRRLTWQPATVVDLVDETPRCKSISLEVPDWVRHQAGQHVDIRLTAEDGYEAQRSYSIASAPQDERLVLTVERLEDGEVSPYLTEVLQPGDEIELRGPIGGYFVWDQSLGGPLVLIAGGSGIVPLRAMLRQWAAGTREANVTVVYSSRSLAEVIYRDELANYNDANLSVHLALTRDWPTDWTGHRGRLDLEFLTQNLPAPAEQPLTYICGPTSFVEAMSQALVAIGHEPGRIRTERFGPTGS